MPLFLLYINFLDSIGTRLSARVEDIVCSLITLAFMVNMFGHIEFRFVSRTTCRNNQDIPNHLQTELVRQRASQLSEPSSRRGSIGVSGMREREREREREIGSRSVGDANSCDRPWNDWGRTEEIRMPTTCACFHVREGLSGRESNKASIQSPPHRHDRVTEWISKTDQNYERRIDREWGRRTRDPPVEHRVPSADNSVVLGSVCCFRSR